MNTLHKGKRTNTKDQIIWAKEFIKVLFPFQEELVMDSEVKTGIIYNILN